MARKPQRNPFFERLKTGLEECLQHLRGEIELKTHVLDDQRKKSKPAAAKARPKKARDQSRG